MDKIQRLRKLLTNPFAVFGSLTAEEREALKWASRGYTYTEIADIVGWSPATANYHLRNGCLKVGISKRDLPKWVFDQILMIVK
jgi:DNA-binding NarL/FixJ family response regulator